MLTIINRLRGYLPLLFVVLLALGCEEEQEPTYLQLSGFEFDTRPGEGAATEGINSVWIFKDNEFFGAFSPDARVPLLESGEINLRFEFGVQENGQTATPNIYDAYAPVNMTLNLVPGEIQEVPVLSVRYSTDINFAFIEGFENGEERAFTDVIIGAGIVERTSDLVRSGSFAGVVELTPTEPVFDVITQTAYDDLIGQIGQVWLEVDFISDVPAVWGVAESDASNGSETARLYDPGFNPRAEWTKIYFNLTEVIVNSELSSYKFGFSTFLRDLEQETGTLYLDNIKVLYF